jgi:hypothetical protein
MCDILFSEAWECGDNDCKARWHKATYWTGKGFSYTVDRYSDGDHERCDKRELPSDEAIAQSWRRYSGYVAQTGLDPLNEFITPGPTSINRVWQARYAHWIGESKYGCRFTGARRRGRGDWRTSKELPAEVRDFLLVGEHESTGESMDNLEAIARKTDGAKVWRRRGFLFVQVTIAEIHSISEPQRVAIRKRIAREARNR